MTTQLEIAEAEAMKLDPAQRLDLMERLAISVEPEIGLHPSWEAEIRRRLTGLDSGTVQAIADAEVFDQLQSLLTRREPV